MESRTEQRRQKAKANFERIEVDKPLRQPHARQIDAERKHFINHHIPLSWVGELFVIAARAVNADEEWLRERYIEIEEMIDGLPRDYYLNVLSLRVGQDQHEHTALCLKTTLRYHHGIAFPNWVTHQEGDLRITFTMPIDLNYQVNEEWKQRLVAAIHTCFTGTTAQKRKRKQTQHVWFRSAQNWPARLGPTAVDHEDEGYTDEGFREQLASMLDLSSPRTVLEMSHVNIRVSFPVGADMDTTMAEWSLLPVRKQ